MSSICNSKICKTDKLTLPLVPLNERRIAGLCYINPFGVFMASTETPSSFKGNSSEIS